MNQNNESIYGVDYIEELNKTLPSGSFDFSAPAEMDAIPSVEYKDEAPKEKKISSMLDIQSLINDSKDRESHRLKSKVEAILFLSDKPRGAESIADQAEADVNLVREALTQLVQEYEDRAGGITIDCANGYCMQIADEHETLTEDILPIALRTAVLRTLSTIALKEPMVQKDLVTIRGGGVYEHVKELVELGLVKKTKEGHSNILNTTKFFQENFKLSQNGLELKEVLRKSTPGEVEFIRNNTLIPGHEYMEEEKVETETEEENASTEASAESNAPEEEKLETAIQEIQEVITEKQKILQEKPEEQTEEINV